jgi:transposase
VRAFEFYQGVPKLVVPDNTKTGVTKACRYDPDLNPTYQEMAMHYGVGVVPARPYKPRDKAKVESGVLLVERWIIAALRHREFFSIEELNQAIRELRDRINQRPFRKREGSRATQFVAMDKPVLSPRLVHELVEVRSTPTTIEIFHKSQRVASHLRAHGHGHAVTIADHRPRSHQAHLEWTPSRMVHWAQTIGPHTARLFERILADKPHPEMGYRSCLGIIRLADQYSAVRVEAAAEQALLTGACRYQSVKSILKNSLDALPAAAPSASSPPPRTTTSVAQSTSSEERQC